MGKKAKEQKRANRFGPQPNKFISWKEQKEYKDYKEAVGPVKLPSIRKQFVGSVYTESETILTDDYPVFPGYLYIMDEYIVESPIQGTVADLKRIGLSEEGKGDEVRRCDIYGRK